MTTLPPSTTDGRPEDEDDQYLEPPTDACPAQPRQILVSATLIRSAIDSLEHVEKFFRRYTNPSVRDDLRAYALAQGWRTGPDAPLDSIAFNRQRPRPSHRHRRT
jgi:hypothetical protein